MAWRTLREQIAVLLDSIDSIQEVAATPSLEFNGYPAAYIVPSDSTSDYETTTENERAYAFLIRVFYETKDTGLAAALARLEDVVDNVIDKVDDEDKLYTGRTIGLNLPAKYTFLAISAAPSVWGQLPSQNLVFAEIKVTVRISFDAT